VSLEADPKLAYDTEGTVTEARMLFKALGRPNVMIKVPATREGIPAIEALIGEGVNVNVTLIFSLAHYEAVVRAYINGLEQLAARGGDLTRVASVASFFVSRIDTTWTESSRPSGTGHCRARQPSRAQRLPTSDSGRFTRGSAGRGSPRKAPGCSASSGGARGRRTRTTPTRSTLTS
jgi:transaldolase